MARILQINTAGSWKSVLTIRTGQPDSENDLELVKTAALQLACASDDVVHWRVIDRERGAQDVVIAAWDRQRGWRTRR
jgi:hypothetical protein